MKDFLSVPVKPSFFPTPNFCPNYFKIVLAVGREGGTHTEEKYLISVSDIFKKTNVLIKRKQYLSPALPYSPSWIEERLVQFLLLPEGFWTISPVKMFNYHVTEFSYSRIKALSISPAGAIPLGLIHLNILRHSENDSVTWGLWYSCGKWGLRVQVFASINI